MTDNRFTVLVHNLRIMRRWLMPLKDRYGLNQVHGYDFFQKRDQDLFVKHVCSVGRALHRHSHNSSEIRLTLWLYDVATLHWGIQWNFHDNPTGGMWRAMGEHASRVRAGVNGNIHIEVLDDLDAALAADSFEQTVRLITLAKLRMP